MSHRQTKNVVQSAIEQVVDPEQRRALAKRSADLGSQISERATEVARVVSDEGQAFLKEHAADLRKAQKEVRATVTKAEKNARGKAAQTKERVAMDLEDKKAARKTKKATKERKRRVRKALVLTGAGAVAAYFLDPDNGAKRRDVARRRTSTSAQVVGDGLEAAANVAHQAAEVTAVDNRTHPENSASGRTW